VLWLKEYHFGGVEDKRMQNREVVRGLKVRWFAGL
jgi:hypothetical protein